MNASRINQTPAYWSHEAIIPGIVSVSALLPGTIAFGMAIGAQCAQINFSLFEVEVMMAFVYGGLSQFVAVQAWPDTLNAPSIAALGLLTLTVNMRFALMSAAMRSWFGTLPAWQAYPSMLLITDAGWLAATRYRDKGGANAWYYTAPAILLYVIWIVAAIPGYLLAGRLSDPRVYGVDLVVPAFYAAMLVPAWKGYRNAIPWVASGVVALVLHWAIGGYWYIIAGALTGAITAGLMSEPLQKSGEVQ